MDQAEDHHLQALRRRRVSFTFESLECVVVRHEEALGYKDPKTPRSELISEVWCEFEMFARGLR